jgi:hypothetical protein
MTMQVGKITGEAWTKQKQKQKQKQKHSSVEL